MISLAGFGRVTRLVVRRERIPLALWVVILGLLPAGVVSGFRALYPDEGALSAAVGLVAANPAMVAFLGEVHAPTYGGLTVWRIGAFQAAFVGILAVLTVVRHTRAEEQSGRRELIGSTAMGRHVPLWATLAVVGAAVLAVGVLNGLVLAGSGLDPTGSFAFGLAITAAGWVQAGVAAVAAQLAESSKTANGIGLGFVGVAYLLRVVGDAGTASGLGFLSWLSPIGLAQQVRPFAGERWELVAVLVGVAVVLVGVAQTISARRDVGEGMLATRRGPARAPRSLAGPLGLAVRLQRGVAVGWLVGLVTFAALIGLITDAFGDLIEQTPGMAEIFARLGGEQVIADAFLAAMLGLFGIVVSAHALQSLLWLRSEEMGGEAEFLLTTTSTRTGWMSSHLTVALGVAVLDLVVAGMAVGTAYAVTIGDPGQVGRVVGAALVQLPAVWLVAGVGLALFGLVPRISRLVWSLLGIWGLLTLLGTALNLPDWMLDLSPFTHVPDGFGTVELVPLVWLTGLAATVMLAGAWGFRRRDVPA